MPERSQIPLNYWELKLESSFVAAFEQRPDQSEKNLFKAVKQIDPEAAYYLLRQAQDQFPDDLESREKAMAIGLSMALLDRGQVAINGLGKRLFGASEIKVSDVLAADLPPAA